jgi:16S rRNA (uracil1498-N3)-methyltransferase
MHRFYLDPEQCLRPPLVLTQREAHHARDVLRLARGQEVIVLDGAGHQFHCKAQAVGPAGVVLEVLEKKAMPPPPCRVTLAQAIPKGKRLETIIQKATELGAARIVPLLAERVASRLDDPAAAQKAAKWRQAAIEAIKQCGQPWLPRVQAPMTVEDFLARQEPFDLALVGSLQAEGRHPRHYFDSFASEHGRRPQSLCVWIGPEGDFTPAELHAIRQAGAKPITLGPLVLRSDTAAIATLAIVNYELAPPSRNQA